MNMIVSYIGAAVKRNMCAQLPLICPQWCMGTGSNGCTECDCAKYSPQISGGSPPINGLGAVSGETMQIEIKFLSLNHW